MSNFTTVYDQIRTEMAAAFSTKAEMAMPDDITRNPEPLLYDSWGLITGPSTLGNFNLLKNSSEDRVFSIVFCRSLHRTVSNPDHYHTAVKALFEDCVTIRKIMVDFDRISQPAAAIQVRYEGTSGTDFAFDDKHNYVTATIDFSITITEEL